MAATIYSSSSSSSFGAEHIEWPILIFMFILSLFPFSYCSKYGLLLRFTYSFGVAFIYFGHYPEYTVLNTN